jgi:asparagine synthase (glutamine-hydrolysing)
LFARVADQPLLNQLLYIDSKTWLPDDLLIKADKVTMASSLELRVPLLDHCVLEFAAGLPPEFKVRGRQTKRVLRAAFERVLPQEILRRKKAGFPVPYGRWLASDLWSDVRDLLLDQQSFVRCVFAAKAIQGILDQHRSSGDFQRELFCLLCLEFWHTQFCKPTRHDLCGVEGHRAATNLLSLG